MKDMNLPEPSLTKNDKLAKRLIWTVSVVVFAVVVLLHELKIKIDLGFDVHIFAKINAIINRQSYQYGANLNFCIIEIWW